LRTQEASRAPQPLPNPRPDRHPLPLRRGSPDLARELKAFKSFTARRIVEALGQRGRSSLLDLLAHHKGAYRNDSEHQVWREGSHPQLIQGEPMMRQKVDYIHQNPVRRGYVDDPLHWRYSSARDYAGEVGLIPVCTDW